MHGIHFISLSSAVAYLRLASLNRSTGARSVMNKTGKNQLGIRVFIQTESNPLERHMRGSTMVNRM